MQLVLDAVSRTYRGGHTAIASLNLSITPGILALLGPNGAGKSTLMRMMATLDQPTSGAIRWNGDDIAKHPDPLRRTLGYLPQDFGVYPQLTGYEFLHYLAAAKRLPLPFAKRRVDELLELVNLTDAARRPLGGYSGGMRQRVGIAQALLNDPKLLIVDEPTVGLDPEERVRFRHLLAQLAHDRIIILSTHIVSDVAAIANRITVLARGRLQADDRPEGVIDAARGRVWEVTVPAGHATALAAAHRVSEMATVANGVKLRLLADTRPVSDAVLVEPTLEDAYLLLAGTPAIAVAA